MNAQEIAIRRESIASRVAKELILALDTELMQRYPEEGTTTHFRLDADEVAPGRGAFLVVYTGDTPVGCGAIRLLGSGAAEIKRMFVKPGARGLGLGRRLLEALEAEGRALGVKTLKLETGPRQPEAMSLYSTMGFSRIDAFGEYVDAPLSLFMGKTL